MLRCCHRYMPALVVVFLEVIFGFCLIESIYCAVEREIRSHIRRYRGVPFLAPCLALDKMQKSVFFNDAFPPS